MSNSTSKIKFLSYNYPKFIHRKFSLYQNNAVVLSMLMWYCCLCFSTNIVYISYSILLLLNFLKQQVRTIFVVDSAGHHDLLIISSIISSKSKTPNFNAEKAFHGRHPHVSTHRLKFHINQDYKVRNIYIYPLANDYNYYLINYSHRLPSQSRPLSALRTLGN